MSRHLIKLMGFSIIIWGLVSTTFFLSDQIGKADTDISFVILEIMGFLTSVTLLFVSIKRNKDLFEPIYLFLFLYWIYFFLKPLFILQGGRISNLYSPLVKHGTIGYAIFVALLFLICFGLGYLTNNIPNRVAAKIPEFGDIPRKDQIIFFLCASSFATIIANLYFFDMKIGGISNAIEGIIVNVDAQKRYSLISTLPGEKSYITQIVSFGKNLLAPTLFLGYFYLFNAKTRISESIS